MEISYLSSGKCDKLDKWGIVFPEPCLYDRNGSFTNKIETIL